MRSDKDESLLKYYLSVSGFQRFLKKRRKKVVATFQLSSKMDAVKLTQRLAVKLADLLFQTNQQTEAATDLHPRVVPNRKKCCQPLQTIKQHETTALNIVDESGVKRIDEQGTISLIFFIEPMLPTYLFGYKRNKWTICLFQGIFFVY